MNIEIPSNTTATKIMAIYPPPRGATHFRFTTGIHKPVIDRIKNLDTLAGCTGTLEYGKVTFDGRGRYAKVKEFIPVATDPTPTVTILEANQPPIVIAQSNGEAPTEAKPSKARKNKIHGFSACAVAKALGATGVKHDEADRIFLAHGIEMPKASLSVQLGFGRRPETWNRHGKPAELTEAQIAELRAGAVA